MFGVPDGTLVIVRLVPNVSPLTEKEKNALLRQDSQVQVTQLPQRRDGGSGSIHRCRPYHRDRVREGREGTYGPGPLLRPDERNRDDLNSQPVTSAAV